MTCNAPGENYAHEYKCDKFYVCDAGSVPILTTCATGTYFDIGSNVCLHSPPVTCTPSSPKTIEYQLHFNFVKVGKFTTRTRAF